jgi:hypothetical protein
MFISKVWWLETRPFACARMRLQAPAANDLCKVTSMRPTHPLYTGMPTTIFEVMSRLAIEHKAVNLGQGFPDVDGPQGGSPSRC